MVHQAPICPGSGAGVVAQHLQSFLECPPRPKPGSFSVDDAMDMLMKRKDDNSRPPEAYLNLGLLETLAGNHGDVAHLPPGERFNFKFHAAVAGHECLAQWKLRRRGIAGQ
jgi:hypothetical protein